MKIYKCYYSDVCYCLKFSDDGERFYSWSDGLLTSYDEYDFNKIEPFEPVDTLQEVVEWCKENDKGIVIYASGKTQEFEEVEAVTDTRRTPTELLIDIRQPKHTPEELEVLELAKKYGIKIELK